MASITTAALQVPTRSVRAAWLRSHRLRTVSDRTRPERAKCKRMLVLHTLSPDVARTPQRASTEQAPSLPSLPLDFRHLDGSGLDRRAEGGQTNSARMTNLELGAVSPAEACYRENNDWP